MNRIEFGKDYIAIYNQNNEEIVRWIKDEWIEDPDIVFSIGNAIKLTAEGKDISKYLEPEWKPDYSQIMTIEESLAKEKKKSRRLTEVFIENLEHIKALLEKYNKSEGSLAEIWDFVNTRLDVYREE